MLVARHRKPNFDMNLVSCLLNGKQRDFPYNIQNTGG